MQAEAPSREEMLENGPAQLPDALNELAGLQACADAGPSDQSLSSRESQQASDETSLDDSGHPSVSGPSCPDFSKKDSDLSASSRSCYEMDCKCRCHLLVRQSRHGSRGFFKYILGSLVLGYISVSSPTGDCDNPACARRENGLTMTLRYTFPTWVAKRVLTSSVSPWGSGPHIFTFATSRRIFYAPGNIFSRINSRDFGGATQLLQNGSANIRDIEARHGVSILGAALRHPALRPGFVRFIEFLFESGVDPHVSNDRGESPWLLASRLILPRTPAFMASPELKDQLRRLFPRLDWDNLHYTHLHMIISGLRPLDLKEALKVPDHHAQINARDALGETPLGLAAMLGDDEAVEALLLAGADPESGARGAPSPIRRAIQSRNRRCVELLLMRCTNPLVLDARGATLVHAAAAGNNTLNVVEPLLLAGIPTDSLNVHRCTPLSFTPLHDNHMVARYLIDRGANINNIDKDGDTPLTEAVRLNAHNCLRLFIESGADVRILNGRLRNVLHFAAAFGDVETLDILCTAKLEPASIQAGDFAGNTPADLLRMRQIQPEGLIEAFGRLVESLSTSNGGSMRSRSTSSTTT
ncbi:ankyrin repeat-containing domain protein [Plectosphaerella plurivora]|uniref:Ankyrin repeat-containing domain protein n=1 Tax=Plectosphaerella plurivora TaxID=936078 RepID=A0A9P8V7S6_9PEZI|nr:ankyrin repeat-containing domain protein [Plectosphaerella plurivora]